MLAVYKTIKNELIKCALTMDFSSFIIQQIRFKLTE